MLRKVANPFLAEVFFASWMLGISGKRSIKKIGPREGIKSETDQEGMQATANECTRAATEQPLGFLAP